MDQRQKQKKISNKQERDVAQELNLKTMPASGATRHGGADARSVGKIRVECKYTDSDKYTLKLADLLKLRNQAIRGGLEEPIFQVWFRTVNSGKYAIVPTVPTDECSLRATKLSKQVVLYSGDLLALLKNGESPLMRLTFFNVPVIHKYEVSIFNWNDYMERFENE